MKPAVLVVRKKSEIWIERTTVIRKTTTRTTATATATLPKRQEELGLCATGNNNRRTRRKWLIIHDSHFSLLTLKLLIVMKCYARRVFSEANTNSCLFDAFKNYTNNSIYLPAITNCRANETSVNTCVNICTWPSSESFNRRKCE